MNGKPTTVEPLYNGHLWGTMFWPLYRGGLCWEVVLYTNCMFIWYLGAWPLYQLAFIWRWLLTEVPLYTQKPWYAIITTHACMNINRDSPRHAHIHTPTSHFWAIGSVSAWAQQTTNVASSSSENTHSLEIDSISTTLALVTTMLETGTKYCLRIWQIVFNLSFRIFPCQNLHGYKMQIHYTHFDIFGNSDVSVSIYLERGESDDQLRWPMCWEWLSQ